jgi:ABC-2 type transport system permease protein
MSALTRSLFLTFPILILTLRQFSSGKAIRVVALFALAPVLFTVVYLIDPSFQSGRSWFDQLFRDILVPTILPLATVILATNALGNELEDRTLVYLVLKPIRRSRIIIEKYSAVVQSTWVTLIIGTVIAWAMASRGDAMENLDMLAAAVLAMLVGVLTYGALFLALSLIITRALIAGIIYILIWESALGRLIPGARLVSIQHYVQSIYARLLSDPEFQVSNALRFPSAMLAVSVLIVLALLFATMRLRAMDLE